MNFKNFAEKKFSFANGSKRKARNLSFWATEKYHRMICLNRSRPCKKEKTCIFRASVPEIVVFVLTHFFRAPFSLFHYLTLMLYYKSFMILEFLASLS